MKLFTVTFLVLVFAASAFAQTPVQKAEPFTTPEYTGEVISLVLKENDLLEFLQRLGGIYGYKFELDPGVSGTLTYKAEKVPWDQALDEILRMQGLVKNVDLSTKTIRISRQVQQAPAVPQPAPVSAPLPRTSQESESSRMTLEAKSMDMPMFLRLISDISGKTVIWDEDLNGIAVNGKFQEMSWEDVLTVVMVNHKLGKDVRGNVIRIAKAETLESEARARYEAAQAAGIQQPQQSQRARIEPAPSVALFGSFAEALFNGPCKDVPVTVGAVQFLGYGSGVDSRYQGSLQLSGLSGVLQNQAALVLSGMVDRGADGKGEAKRIRVISPATGEGAAETEVIDAESQVGKNAEIFGIDKAETAECVLHLSYTVRAFRVQQLALNGSFVDYIPKIGGTSGGAAISRSGLAQYRVNMEIGLTGKLLFADRRVVHTGQGIGRINTVVMTTVQVDRTFGMENTNTQLEEPLAKRAINDLFGQPIPAETDLAAAETDLERAKRTKAAQDRIKEIEKQRAKIK